MAATTGYPDFDRIIYGGIVSEQLIEVIHIYALDKAGDDIGEIVIKIDWERNKFHVDGGRNAVTVAQKVPDGERFGVLIAEIVTNFRRLTEPEGCRTEWTLLYRPGVDGEAANTKLGLMSARRRKQAPGKREWAIGGPSDRLDEVAIDFFMVIPPTESGEEGELRGDKEEARERGTVKWFNTEKGYGFIKVDKQDKDLFVHISQVPQGSILVEGTIVEFDIANDHRGRGQRAVNVKVVKGQ